MEKKKKLKFAYAVSVCSNTEMLWLLTSTFKPRSLRSQPHSLSTQTNDEKKEEK